MKRLSQSLSYLIISFLLIVAQAAAGQKLPVIDGKEVVAIVNNEPITAADYSYALASIEHGEMDPKQKAENVDYAGIMNRLVNEKLLLIEAGNIGIDELPEVTEMIEKYADKALMKTLLAEQMKNVIADQEKIEKRFRSTVREFKITAVVFENEKDAKAMKEALKSGEEFDDLAKKVIEDGSAKEILEGEYLKNKDLWPEVSAIISEMEIGSLGPIVAFKQGFVLLRLDDIRYPENPEIRSRIERALANMAKEIALEDYTETLIKKYVEIDDVLLESIDYDTSMEDFKALLKDERIVAKVKNGNPVTVGALSASFENAYYHGVEDPLKHKELNNRKNKILTELLQKIVLKKEAMQQGLDKADKYKIKLNKYRDSLVLWAFVQKVVAPDIKLTEDELKVYYDENVDSYTSPEMMRIDDLVFNDRRKAEDALDKLKKGTAIKWLRSNATGQVPPETPGLLRFNGTILNPENLPPKARKTLRGASLGDYRLHESSEGYFYVTYIQDVFPSKSTPYENVKKEIAEKVYNEKLARAVDDWANQLKEYYKVEIYLKDF